MRDSREARSGVADCEACRAAFCRARGVLLLLLDGVGGVWGGKGIARDVLESREAVAEGAGIAVVVAVAPSTESARGWKGRGDRWGGEAGLVGCRLGESEAARLCSGSSPASPQEVKTAVLSAWSSFVVSKSTLLATSTLDSRRLAVCQRV